ncbi:PANK2 [Symbiodinium sp. KB8]|nr:PANK2 [Symbiodinium sp. KB8]
MGQSQTAGEDEASPQSTEGKASGGYGNLTVPELKALAAKRGLPVPAELAPGMEKPLLSSILRSYDIGRKGTRSGSMCMDAEGNVAAANRSKTCTSVLSALQKIRDAPGHMGCDIGGSLAKMVLALPEHQAAQYRFPESFGTSGRTQNHLEMTIELHGTKFVLRFISGSTSQLEMAVAHLGDRRRDFGRRATSEPLTCDDDSDEGDRNPQPIRATSGDTGAMRAVSEVMGESPRFTRTFSSWSDEVFTSSDRPFRRMATAGGGACKFAPLFREALRVELEPVREMAAMVDGLLLLAPPQCLTGTDGTGGSSGDGTQQDIFTITEDGATITRPWPEPLFPMILVITGTGVSILRVDSAAPGDFVRVGGTACGGGTFLGLARMLTSAKSFDEALILAAEGNAQNADKLVSDIYGEEGCVTLGLPGNLTASNFGKLGEMSEAKCSERDLARSLLQMVTQQSVLLASAHAKMAGCIDRVFFAGGFVDEKNWIARKAIAANFRNLQGCAYFLRHSDFLGALGSLRGALRALEGCRSPTAA